MYNNENVNISNFKLDIENCDLGINFIKQLNPVSFRFIDGRRRHYGLLGEDLKRILDENKIDSLNFAPYIDSAINNPNFDSIKDVRYEEFISIIIKSIQEMSETNTTLQDRLDSLEQTNTTLQDRLDSIEEFINRR